MMMKILIELNNNKLMMMNKLLIIMERIMIMRLDQRIHLKSKKRKNQN